MDSFLKALRLKAKLSERKLAQQAGVSRLTLRAIESGQHNGTLQSLTSLCQSLDRKLVLLAIPNADCPSESSSVVTSMLIRKNGFKSWPIHLMEMVDDFRKTLDPRLILLPPVRGVDMRITALIASTVLQLCYEQTVEPPPWAEKMYFLDRPFFPARSEDLKAMAILESPLPFRRNNIYVLDNFLKRG